MNVLITIKDMAMEVFMLFSAWGRNLQGIADSTQLAIELSFSPAIVAVPTEPILPPMSVHNTLWFKSQHVSR